MTVGTSPDAPPRVDIQPSWLRPLLFLSALLFCVGLILDVLWDKIVFIFLTPVLGTEPL